MDKKNYSVIRISVIRLDEDDIVRTSDPRLNLTNDPVGDGSVFDDLSIG